MTGLYPSVSQTSTEDTSLLKLQSRNLFNKLEQLEKKFKHYRKLKHKCVSKIAYRLLSESAFCSLSTVALFYPHS